MLKFYVITFLAFRSANNATPKEETQPQQDESESIISSASQSAGLFEQEVSSLRPQDVTSQFVTKPDVYGRGQQQQQQQPVGQEIKERKDNSRLSQTTGNTEIEQLKYVQSIPLITSNLVNKMCSL